MYAPRLLSLCLGALTVIVPAKRRTQLLMKMLMRAVGDEFRRSVVIVCVSYAMVVAVDPLCRIVVGGVALMLMPQVVLVHNCFFFFQAEDGIRDYKVTGVQTCALPIYPFIKYDIQKNFSYKKGDQIFHCYGRRTNRFLLMWYGFCIKENKYNSLSFRVSFEIGRASCRERV